MSVPRDLRTERLLLRRWLSTDRVPFAALNADPRVMEHLPAPLSLEESDRLAAAIEAHFDRHGFGLWAVEIPGVVTFAGFVGAFGPTLHGAIYAVRGDRLASGRRALGSGVRHRGCAGGAGIRLCVIGARRDCLVHRAWQPPLAPRDGEHRDGSRPGRRLRSSGTARGTSSPAPRPLQNYAGTMSIVRARTRTHFCSSSCSRGCI